MKNGNGEQTIVPSGLKAYLVIDPTACMPIFEIKLYAEGIQEARLRALEAMMGCPIENIDPKAIEESLTALVVTEA